MFELIPFDRHSRNMSAFDPFRMLDEMDRRFMNAAPSVSASSEAISSCGSENTVRTA